MENQDVNHFSHVNPAPFPASAPPASSGNKFVPRQCSAPKFPVSEPDSVPVSSWEHRDKEHHREHRCPGHSRRCRERMGKLRHREAGASKLNPGYGFTSVCFSMSICSFSPCLEVLHPAATSRTSQGSWEPPPKNQSQEGVWGVRGVGMGVSLHGEITPCRGIHRGRAHGTGSRR